MRVRLLQLTASEPLVEAFVAAVEEPLSNIDRTIEAEAAAVESATAIEEPV